jgi:hypothetical protein
MSSPDHRYGLSAEQCKDMDINFLKDLAQTQLPTWLSGYGVALVLAMRRSLVQIG